MGAINLLWSMERKRLYVVTQWANRKRTKSQWKNPKENSTSEFRWQAELREKWKQKLKQNKNIVRNIKKKKTAYSGGAELVTARTLDFQRGIRGQNLKQDYT